MEAIAARSPSWSRSALPRGGGPCGRTWRKGRSQRRTVNPDAHIARASATRRGESQFDPAPCVRTRQSPPGLVGRCRNPRTGTSFCGASKNSRSSFILASSTPVSRENTILDEGTRRSPQANGLNFSDRNRRNRWRFHSGAPFRFTAACARGVYSFHRIRFCRLRLTSSALTEAMTLLTESTYHLIWSSPNSWLAVEPSPA